MSAKDYEICPALFNAYIARVSKRNPNKMTDDRREIREGEILMLIDWYLDQQAEKFPNGLAFDSLQRKGMRIEMQFVKKEEKKEEKA